MAWESGTSSQIPLVLSRLTSSCAPCQAEIGGDRGKDDNTVSKEASSAGTDGTRGLLGRKECSHDRKGYCSTHGCMARKLSRRIPCVIRNAEGVEVKSFMKKPYFECELGPRGQ